MDSFYLDTVEMSSSSNGSNGSPTSISAAMNRVGPLVNYPKRPPPGLVHPYIKSRKARRIAFNPVAIAQNKETHPLGPNNGPKRSGDQLVEGFFLKLTPGYTGNYNNSVAQTLSSLWQTREERDAEVSSPYNKRKGRLPSNLKKKFLGERVKSLRSSGLNTLPPNEINTLPAHERGKTLRKELNEEGTSGGRRATGRKQKKQRKQKTRKQRKNRK